VSCRRTGKPSHWAWAQRSCPEGHDGF